MISRTTYELLPRSVTNARQRLEGGGHGFAVGLEVALEGETEGDGALAVLGAGVEPQAAASRVVMASTRIHPAVLMSCNTNAHNGRLVMT